MSVRKGKYRVNDSDSSAKSQCNGKIRVHSFTLLIFIFTFVSVLRILKLYFNPKKFATELVTY